MAGPVLLLKIHKIAYIGVPRLGVNMKNLYSVTTFQQISRKNFDSITNRQVMPLMAETNTHNMDRVTSLVVVMIEGH